MGASRGLGSEGSVPHVSVLCLCADVYVCYIVYENASRLDPPYGGSCMHVPGGQNCTRLGEAGGCQLVTIGMNAFPDDRNLQHVGCAAVANLAIGNATNAARLVKAGARLAVQRAMEIFKEVGKEVLAILEIGVSEYGKLDSVTGIRSLELSNGISELEYEK